MPTLSKLTKLNNLLSRSPFRAITISGLNEYKFYDARTWNYSAPPEWDEVIGNTVYGWPKAQAYAKGIILGYAQNTILVRRAI